VRVLLTGGPSALERETAAEIERLARRPLTNLVGQDTLKQWLALMRRCDLLISPDSGPIHMANALGRRVLGLYAATDAERSGPYGQTAHCVNVFAEVAQQFNGKRPEQLRWGSKIEQPGVMALISVEAVQQQIQAAIASGFARS
jgi:heptosyltransferase I